MNLRFGWLDAASLLVLWAVQFVVPSLRAEVSVAYLIWCAWQIGLFLRGKQELAAPRVLLEVIRANQARKRGSGRSRSL